MINKNNSTESNRKNLNNTQSGIQPKQQIKAPEISLPKGGGAQRSIDEKFKMNSANGTFSFAVPLPFSPGRGGVSPALSLQYNAGSGNSTFGIGWNVDYPIIQRKTDKQLPRYDEAEESDIYIFSGAEDLVPYLQVQPDGKEKVDLQWVDGYTIKRYRPRVEGSFALIERIQPDGASCYYWKVTAGNNTVTFFGKSPAYRLSDPEDPARIYKWLPEFGYDDKGSCTMYDFKAEDLMGVKPLLHEKNRLNGSAPFSNKYLKRICYGNRAAFYPDELPLSAAEKIYAPVLPQNIEFHFEAVFDYGEHTGNAPAEDSGSVWPVRLEPFSDYRAGFEIRTYRLCHRVLMFHRFEELGETPCLVRSIDFIYGSAGDVTYLKSVTARGFIRKGDVYEEQAAAPLELDYQELEWNTAIHELPAESYVNVPEGLTGNYQWTDLYGEGISGIFSEEANGWYYKSNEGGGYFSPARQVSQKPNFVGINNNSLSFQDLDADGGMQLVVNQSGLQGYFEIEKEGGYSPFIPFNEMPEIDLSDPNVKFLDLNGDGQPELLIEEDQVFRWYPRKGKQGYGAPQFAMKEIDEEQGPDALNKNTVQLTVMADMTGDGLTDIVRIGNGEICYWPNRGYGKFGARITMSNAPVFDRPDQFNIAYLRISDISGTGTADICYLGGNTCKIWMNQSGNTWSESACINSFPVTAAPGQLAVLDLLGSGTGCLVWSSPLPWSAAAPIQYVDLMGGKKPHILKGYKNNSGLEVEVQYRSSAFYYLKDKKEGKPWRTKLPFPVQCVSSIHTTDKISGTRFSSSYTYHHGCYDQTEREFRGFSMVESTDTEAYEDYKNSSFPRFGQTDEPELFQPPVTTKTWYHTGIYPGSGQTTHQLYEEYYPAFKGYSWATRHELPGSLTTQVLSEACRALKGMVLHQEIYSYDGSTLQDHPYSIVHHKYEVKLLQNRMNKACAVFLAGKRESLSFELERNIEDPRITQQLNIRTDDWGNVLESAAIAYGRRLSEVSLPETADTECQSKDHITYSIQAFTKLVLKNGNYRLPVSCEEMIFELNTPAPLSGFFKAEGISALFGTARIQEYNETLTVGEKKKLGHTRHYYMKNDLSAALPLGTADTLMLTWQSYQMAFTRHLVTTLYEDRVTGELLRNEGYISFEDDPDYWIASGRILHDSKSGFYLPLAFEDNLGYKTSVFYDAYKLHVQRASDAMNNETRALGINYRTGSPYLVQDMNGNRAGTRQDAFGRLISTFKMGKEGKKSGDLMDTSVAEVSATDRPCSVISYEHRYYSSQGRFPDRRITQTREAHYYSENTGNEDPETSAIWHTAYTYSNGSGTVVLTKMQAEPGMAPLRDDSGALVFADGILRLEDTGTALRWIGNGRTVFNNKGKAVKQYDPYFDSISEFNNEEELAALGFTPLMFYDAIGRLIRTEHADGSISSVEFDTWKTIQFDRNDNVKSSRWYRERMSGAKGSHGKKAAEQSAVHDLTPQTSHQDALGRTFLSVLHNRAQYPGRKVAEEQFLYTRTTFDAVGNTLAVTDGRGNEVVSFRYNMLSAVCWQRSMDAGTSRIFSTTSGNNLITWDSLGRIFTNVYDKLYRLTAKIAGEGEAAKVYEQVVYGDALLTEDPAANNLRGKIYKQYDSAGLITMNAYDLSGNLISSQRQLLADYKSTPDWSAAPALESEVFTQHNQYDALNRVVYQILPDGSITKPTYNPSGLLNAIYTDVQGKGTQSAFVNNINYNAKGQRECIYYGNGTVTRYIYEPETCRLLRQLTTANRGAQILQDLRYTYDPSGNITHILDNAQNPVFYDGRRIVPQSNYVYNSLYQLISATGREHPGQIDTGDPQNESLRGVRAQPNDPVPLRDYRQQYHYDAAGNMLEQQHIAGTGSWTREFQYMPHNNRLELTNIGETSFEFSYNEHGSMLQLPELSMIDWNEKEQLHHAGLNGGGNAWYVYAGNGARIRKIIERPGGLREERIYLGAFELYKETQQQQVTLERQTLKVMDGQQLVAIVETRTMGTDNNPMQLKRYQYNNFLQSCCMELDDKGQLISYEEYHPFGTTSYYAVSKTISAAAKRYRFTGKERDEESGLYDHGSRYYASWLCRWTTADPIGVKGGMNFYTYVLNNPVNMHDPDGRQAEGPQDRVLALGRDIDGVDYMREAKINTGKMPVNIQDMYNFDRYRRMFFYPSSMEIEKEWTMKVPTATRNLQPGYSAVMVQEALEGKVVGTVHFSLKGVDNILTKIPKGENTMESGSSYHTTAEIRQGVAHLNSTPAGERKVDIVFSHEGGISTIKKGANKVEGAPLPKVITDHLNPEYHDDGYKPPVPTAASEAYGKPSLRLSMINTGIRVRSAAVSAGRFVRNTGGTLSRNLVPGAQEVMTSVETVGIKGTFQLAAGLATSAAASVATAGKVAMATAASASATAVLAGGVVGALTGSAVEPMVTEATGSKSTGVAAGTLAGAASGALMGAAIGSVVPGLGTAAGAIIGGAAGAIGGYISATW